MAQQIPLSLRSFGRPFERLLLVIYKTQGACMASLKLRFDKDFKTLPEPVVI